MKKIILLSTVGIMFFQGLNAGDGPFKGGLIGGGLGALVGGAAGGGKGAGIGFGVGALTGMTAGAIADSEKRHRYYDDDEVIVVKKTSSSRKKRKKSEVDAEALKQENAALKQRIEELKEEQDVKPAASTKTTGGKTTIKSSK